MPLHEFPENCVDKQLIKLFYWILHRTVLTVNFLSYDIESAKKSAFIGFAYKKTKQYISCSITKYLPLSKYD